MSERRMARMEEKLLQKLARRFIRTEIKRFYASFHSEYTPNQLKRVKTRLKKDVPILLRKVVSENITSTCHTPTYSTNTMYENLASFENISMERNGFKIHVATVQDGTR